MRRLLALTMLQRGLSVGVYVIATMIIARILTPAQVGIYSLGAALLAVAGVVREFGITEYLMQEKHLDRDRIRAAYGVSIVVGWSMGALILLLRGPIAAFYGEPGVARVLEVMCLTFAFLPFATPTTALLYRDLEIERVLWIQTIALIVGHVASVLMAVLGLGYMALAWGGVVNSLCMVTILLASRRDALRYLPALRGSQPVWSYCNKFTLSGVLETGGRNIHEFIIGRRFGFEPLGLYSRAASLFVQFQQNVGRGISRVLLPNFARHARDGTADLGEQYRATLRMYTGFVWPMYALVACVAPEIIRVMFGPQWAASAPLLRLLCVGAVVQAGYAFAGDLLGGMGQAGARLRITGVTTPLWAVLCVAASFISLKAIALASAAQAAVVLILYGRELRRLVGWRWADWLVAVGQSALMAGIVGVASLLARAALVRESVPALVVLAAVALVALAAWMASAHLLRHPVASELALVYRAVSQRLPGRQPASDRSRSAKRR